MPLHIAIIPDGNRRWARAHGLQVFLGHREGAKQFEPIIEAAIEQGVTHLTIWGCSINNLEKRDQTEVRYLIDLFEEYFRNLADNPKTSEQGLKIRALGLWRKYFTSSAIAEVDRAVSKTANQSGINLTFMLGYNGTEEILNAIGSIISTSAPITSENLKANLYTKDLPSVDLVIRTGGDPHLSTGFMMWDTAEAALHFSDSLWPDFSAKEFTAILSSFQSKEKRGGK